MKDVPGAGDGRGGQAERKRRGAFVESRGHDGGVAISRTIAGVSADGISCHSWAHCLHVLDTSDAWGNNINYEGQSGSIDFGSDLSAVPSHYGVFILDAKNSPKPAP
ncbi:MAG TPA: hypothetical protein PK890_09730 [Terrimesophilobacter sp.]|nr:hypothetical protein [Terrimesophilobacter sp.]